MLHIINRILQSLYSRSRKLYTKISWNLDLLKTKKSKNTVLPHLPENRYILLVPHADDEWMTNSMLVRYANDVILVNMDMRGGDSDALHIVRRQEIESVAYKYFRPLHTLECNKVESLKVLLQSNPNCTIVLPFFVDWHPEHLEVIEIFKTAIAQIEHSGCYKVLMYPVSCPMPIDYITHANRMCKAQWTEKWDLFKNTYKTQIGIPFRRFSIVDRIYGKYVGAFAAEVYCLSDMADWKQLSEKVVIQDDMKYKLRNNLNRISFCIDISSQYLKKLWSK